MKLKLDQLVGLELYSNFLTVVLDYQVNAEFAQVGDLKNIFLAV